MENINFTNVRVRIAPSPTGFVHIGNLRTILYNFLFAKHYKGEFIIRIEDTDQARLVPGAVENLLRVLQWTGIEGDEGPHLTIDNKIKERGDYAPYTQSARLDIYKQQIHVLLDKNKAYHCFCSKERLEKLRADQVANKQAPRYDNFCRDLTKEEVQSRLAKGEPRVVRFKMPENKNVICHDLIHGNIAVNTDALDDYVLVKADGFPTYHFANVVDDHQMKITHVLRGDEWIASLPKHVLLYEAFSWQAPAFAHLPVLLGKNKQKLSKRDGDTNVQDFIDKGYLRDALLNFIALLGWNSGSEQEIFSWDELVKQFTLDNVHKAGAVFDLDKLDWINGVYIRKMPADEFYRACMPYLTSANYLTEDKDRVIINATGERVKPTYIKNLLTMEQPRLKQLNEVGDALSYCFTNNLEYDATGLIWKKSDKEKTLSNLQALEKLLKKMKVSDFKTDKLQNAITDYLLKNNIDTGSMLWPMRFALSGRDKSPGPFELAAGLGKARTLERITAAISKLQK